MHKILADQITETVAPVVEPVTLTEAKAHCRVDGTDHDTILTSMISAARVWCENYLQRSLVQRTYRADTDYFYASYDLPMKPMQSLTSVYYYSDTSPQALTLLDSEYYRADTGRGQIYLDYHSSALPATAVRRDAVQITYVAGYSPDSNSPQDSAGNIPAPIKAAILLQVAELFERREVNSEMRLQEMPTVTMLLSSYRNY